MRAILLSFCRNLYFVIVNVFPGKRALSNLRMATVSAQFKAAFSENVKHAKKKNKKNNVRIT